jgi:hypothetical protein
MRLLGTILVIIIGVLLILTFLPVGVFGEERVDVEVSARVNQSKIIGFVPGFKAYNIDNVNHRVVGVTSFIEWDSLLFIADFGSLTFCIDDICQKNGEIFWMSPGEQRTSTEIIHGITRGDHTLKITFTVDETVEDTYTELIQI